MIPTPFALALVIAERPERTDGTMGKVAIGLRVGATEFALKADGLRALCRSRLRRQASGP